MAFSRILSVLFNISMNDLEKIHTFKRNSLNIHSVSSICLLLWQGMSEPRENISYMSLTPNEEKERESQRGEKRKGKREGEREKETEKETDKLY